METEDQAKMSEIRTSRVGPVLRHLLAALVTFTVLPYCWARSIVFWMSSGGPENFFFYLLVGSFALLIPVTYGLGRRFQRPKTKYWVMAGVVAGWLGVNTALILLNVSTDLPYWQLIPGFLPATLFAIWVAWIGYFPWSWRARLSVLAVTALLMIPFFAIYRVAGLTGNGKVIFAFRSTAPPKFEPLDVSESSSQVRSASVELHVQPGDFPQFLGPNRDGVVEDVALDPDWDARPPKLLWRHRVGLGWSGFAIVGDFALTQEQRNEFECVVCYDWSSGAEVWVHQDDTNYDAQLGGPGPRATPTIRDNHVYTWGATGLLNCLDGSTGKPIWSKNVLEESGTQNLTYGISTSPLVTESLVYIGSTGSNGPSLVAYDRETGEQACGGGDSRISYSSPILTQIAGIPQILNFARDGLFSHAPSTGEVLWQHAWSNNSGVNASQPLQLHGKANQIFLSTGYGKGSTLIDVSLASDGQWQVETSWTSRQMKTKFTTATIHGDYVYGLDNGIFQCVSLETGASVWKRGRYGHGQILKVGDYILVQAEQGDVILVQPDPDKLIELGRIPALSSKTWNTLAYAHGKLLVRNDREAACYELPIAAE